MYRVLLRVQGQSASPLPALTFEVADGRQLAMGPPRGRGLADARLAGSCRWPQMQNFYARHSLSGRGEQYQSDETARAISARAGFPHTACSLAHPVLHSAALAALSTTVSGLALRHMRFEVCAAIGAISARGLSSAALRSSLPARASRSVVPLPPQDNAVLPVSNPPPAAGAGAALWLNSAGDGEVVSRAGTSALLRRFIEKIHSLVKDGAPRVRACGSAVAAIAVVSVRALWKEGGLAVHWKLSHGKRREMRACMYALTGDAAASVVWPHLTLRSVDISLATLSEKSVLERAGVG